MHPVCVTVIAAEATPLHVTVKVAVYPSWTVREAVTWLFVLSTMIDGDASFKMAAESVPVRVH